MMSRKISILLLAFGLMSLNGFAQENEGLKHDPKQIAALTNTATSFGAMISVYNPRYRTIGSHHLFENWTHYAIIHTTTGNQLLLKNINLNLKTQGFESQISTDSIFTFDYNNVEKFVIDGKTYKNYFWNNDNRVYEIIADNGEIQVLKGFSIRMVEGNSNPMLNRKFDKYVQNEQYFSRINGVIKLLPLKEKKILKLLNLPDQKEDELLSYVKNNEYSFKNEHDLKEILEYSTSL